MDSQTVSALVLHNPHPHPASRIVTVSLPLPARGQIPPGFAGLATQAQDIAWWPDALSDQPRTPRRRLLYGLTNRRLPARLRLGTPTPNLPGSSPTTVRLRAVKQDLTGLLPYQIGEAVFRWRNRSLGLRLGIRWRDQLHWWQWLRLETLWSGPLVHAVRIGGYIEVDPARADEFQDPRSFYGTSRLHRHDWIFADVVALCFANGVVQIHARHINNHRFDEGRELHPVVPLLAFRPDRPVRLAAPWDGSRTDFALGSTRLNLADAAPLVSPAHPGALRSAADLVLFQPYSGVEVSGGRRIPYRVQAWEQKLPKGVARTVRFQFALGDTAPLITRLTLPEWWYALTGDLWPDNLLPVHDDWDRRIQRTYRVNARDQRGRFDEGILAHHWEGEAPYVQLLHFYRSGQLEHWRRALRDAYHIADIAFDHSTEMIRMHDAPFNGWTSPALFRTVGLLFGYLETGDPYLRDIAETAAHRWYGMDRLNWPRYAYGRDAMSIRSLIFLWDYTGQDSYRHMAREALTRLIQTQDPDGSYPDQGGTTGLHAMGQVCRKPWMANLATDPILDYLLRHHDDPDLWRAVRQTGHYLLCAFQPGHYWPYQTSYGGALWDPWIALRTGDGQLPTRLAVAHGHKARLLCLLTRQTNDPRFFDTWLRFYDRHWANHTPTPDINTCLRTLQHLPFAQAHRWNAHWRNGAIELNPLPSAYQRQLRGRILTPLGPVTLTLRQRRGRWTILKRAGAPVVVTLAHTSP